MLKNTNLTEQERISKNIEKWYILEPLYFLVWTTHELVINPLIKTMRTGNGRVEYNPDFIKNLSDVQLNAVLQAEVLRIVLKHPYLRKKENASAAYLASNITVKEYTETPLDFPSAEQIFGTKDFDKKHFEFYYHKILENAQNAPQLQGGGGGKGDNNEQKGGTDDNSNDEKDDSTPPQYSDENEDETDDKTSETQGIPAYTNVETSGTENTELWSDNEWLSNLINEKIETAMQSQSWGKLPHYLQEMIVASMRPKLDYRRVLSAFRQSVLSSKRTLTRMKPSRRYDFQYMGSRRDFCTRLLFALDVSGSVSSEELQKGLATLNQCFKYGIESIDVIQFDTEIKGATLTLKKARKSLEIVGRGGTSFDPVMAYIDKNRDYDGLIIFTDGYAQRPLLPKNNRTKIFWLFNNEANYKAMAKNVDIIGKAAFLK